MTYLILVLLGTIWGASYLFIKVGGESVPPLTLVALRATIAALGLTVALRVRGEKLPPLRHPLWRWLAIMGLVNSVIPYTLITWGEVQISSGLAAILVGAMPIFTVLLAHWLTHDEKMTPLKVAGILTGFAGIVILFVPDLLGGLQWSLAGGLATLLAAVSYALATILARRHLSGISHITASLGQMLMASAMLVPLSIIVDRPWTLSPTLPSLAAIATLALLGTAFAYILYYWLIAHVGATRTSLVTYISPVIAVVLGAVFLHEALHWSTLLGLALIVAGVGLVTDLLRTRRAARAPALARAVAEKH